MVSGAAPSKAKMLHGDVPPVSGRRSSSGRPYGDPGAGFSPKMDRCSDSSAAWCRTTSSLVIVFFVTASTAPGATGTLRSSPRSSSSAAHRTRPRPTCILVLNPNAFAERCDARPDGRRALIPPRAIVALLCDIVAAILSKYNPLTSTETLTQNSKIISNLYESELQFSTSTQMK